MAQNRRKKILFLNFLSVCFTVPFGQKPSYSNFHENKLRLDPGSPHFKSQNSFNFIPFSRMLDHFLLLHKETTSDTIPITNMYLCCLIKRLHKHMLKDLDVIVLKMPNLPHLFWLVARNCRRLFSSMSTEQLLLGEIFAFTYVI